jgi:hypothetical protein
VHTTAPVMMPLQVASELGSQCRAAASFAQACTDVSCRGRVAELCLPDGQKLLPRRSRCRLLLPQPSLPPQLARQGRCDGRVVMLPKSSLPRLYTGSGRGYLLLCRPRPAD